MSRILRALFVLAILCGARAEGAEKYKLSRGDESRTLTPLEIPGGDWLSLREPAGLLGLTLAWDDGGSLLLSSSRGRWVLPLDQAFAYPAGAGKERKVLPAPLTLTAGGPAVTAETLAALLPYLGLGEAVLEAASSSDLSDGSDKSEVSKEKPQPAPKARTASFKTIVIDPGHGGYDSGAIGRQHRTYEKDACLDIAKRLAELLKKSNARLKVVLTRNRDEYISLEDRTHLANRLDADLFISIHNNSSRDPESHGTQVFYYDSESSSREAAGLARRENYKANYLKMLFMDLRKVAVRDPSIRLASSVEKEITRSLNLKGRRLQYAPFYVLAMTNMPAILVETAFISNAREEKMLRTPAFRQQVAEAIFEGVMGFRS